MDWLPVCVQRLSCSKREALWWAALSTGLVALTLCQGPAVACDRAGLTGGCIRSRMCMPLKQAPSETHRRAHPGESALIDVRVTVWADKCRASGLLLLQRLVGLQHEKRYFSGQS